MCSQKGPRGKAKKYHEGENCCWDCFFCAEFQVRKIHEDIHPANNNLNIQTDKTFSRLLDETLCILSPLGTLPNKDKTFCTPVPEVYLTLDSTCCNKFIFLWNHLHHPCSCCVHEKSLNTSCPCFRVRVELCTGRDFSGEPGIQAPRKSLKLTGNP